jgi:hypothetical protein
MKIRGGKMTRLVLWFSIWLLMVSAIATVPALGFVTGRVDQNDTKQRSSQKARVQIQVVADSSNSLQANLEVPVGTLGRDLMDRLFKMDYMDVTRRFVTGIAGFSAAPKEKKYWKLEIDGKASEVGIAEIKINKPMRMRWVIAEIR